MIFRLCKPIIPDFNLTAQPDTLMLITRGHHIELCGCDCRICREAFYTEIGPSLDDGGSR